MAVTGSKTLAAFLKNKGLGITHADKSVEDKLNLALAERILRPDVGTNAKQQRIANFDVAQDQLGALLSGTGIQLPKINENQIKEHLGEGFDLSSFGRVEADALEGNTAESRKNAHRLRDNLLLGESADFVRPFNEPNVKQKAFTVSDQLDPSFEGLRNIKGLNAKSYLELQQQNPQFSDKELQQYIEQAGTLLSNVKNYAQKAEFAGTEQERMTYKKLTEQAQSLLGDIGYTDEAHTAVQQGSGVMAGSVTDQFGRRGHGGIDQENLPDTFGEDAPTAEQGSQAALLGAQQQIDEYNRVYGNQAGFTPSPASVQNPNNIDYNRPDTSGFISGNPTRRSIRDGTNIVMGEGERRGFGGGMQLNAQGQYVPQNMKQPTQQQAREQNVEQRKQDRMPTSQMDVQGQVTPQITYQNPKDAAHSSASSTAIQNLNVDPDTASMTASNAMSSGYAEYDALLQTQLDVKDETIDNATKRDEDRQEYIQGWKDAYEKSFNEGKKTIDKIYEEQRKFLEQKEKAAMAKLDWEEQQKKAEARKNSIEEVLQMERDLALSGGFASGQGLKEIRQTEHEWKMAILELGQSYDFKRIDKAIEFTESRKESDDKYLMDSNANKDAYEAELERLDTQSFESDQAREAAEEKALTDYMTATAKTRLELAKARSEDVKDMMELQEKANKKLLDGMMSTKDKLGYISSLDTAINQKKIIQLANDVDGFYGALEASYDRYIELYNQWKSGDTKFINEHGEIKTYEEFVEKVALGPSQGGVLGSLARMFDPGSIVRSEEFERLKQGQSLKQQAIGLYETLKAGGAGLSHEFILETKKTADAVSNSWEEKLQREMQPIIQRIDAWNTSYPEAPINYTEVFDMNRVHLPEQTMNTWSDAANSDVQPSGEDSYGLFQINMDASYAESRAKKLGISSKEELYDPMTNAKAAYQISGGGTNWTPWTTYTKGTYKSYLGFNPNGKVGEKEKNNIINTLESAGFSGDSLETAFAIVMAESGGRANARYNPGGKNIALNPYSPEPEFEITFEDIEDDEEETTEIIHTIAGDVEVTVKPKKKEPPQPVNIPPAPSTIGTTILS